MKAIERLAQAIEYPDEIPADSVDYSFSADDLEIRAQEANGRLTLSGTVFVPPRDGSGDETLVKLADYAAGRILREEAVLAWDPSGGAAMLWQEFPADARTEDLRRFFEVFMASLDWWRDRAENEGEMKPQLPEFVIRP